MELVDELAFPVPFQVISDLLGIPADRADEMREWSQCLTAALEPTTTMETLDAAEDAMAKMGPYLVEVDRGPPPRPRRRRAVGACSLAEEEGDRLTTTSCCRSWCCSTSPATRRPST